MAGVGQAIGNRRGAIVLAAIAAVALALTVGFASIGGPAPPATTIAAVIDTLVRAGLPAALYVVAAIGLGGLLAPVMRGSGDRAALQVGLGLALLLSVSHALGCLGLLGGERGRIVATLVVAVGVALAVSQSLRIRRTAEPWNVAAPAIAILALPGVALLAAAACQPPGWLWRSEFGGFDALSYHLQLPQEWLAVGRIVPLEHNVYSYLPGYVESAFMHLGAMTGAPTSGPGPIGLVAGDGIRLLSCQFLHAWLAVISAWLIARCVHAALRAASTATARPAPTMTGSAGASSRPTGGPSRTPGAIAGVLFLLTPWIIVVGSLAYNEMGVTALGAAAMLVAMDRGLSPTRRGAIAGLLVGVACGCKATALLFVAPPVGVLLLGLAPTRHCPRLVVAGAATGLIAIAPWLIRNTLHASNPVFPYLTSTFGTAHWSSEQAARFAAATLADEPILDRLRLLFLVDPADPAGPRHRGMLHPQWSVFFPAALAASCVALARPLTRRIALLLSIGLLTQLLAWLFASHLQSRFLIPLMLPGCILIGLAADALRGPVGGHPARRPVGIVLGAVAAFVPLASSIRAFVGEHDGRPNALLTVGPGALTGTIFASLEEAERLAEPTPEVLLNLSAPAPRRVYLFGDSTPLYLAVPMIYATTWDRSPMAEAIRAAPDDPSAWTGQLRKMGIDLVLVNLPQLDRLRHSGYLDPTLTPETVASWLRTGRVRREWPRAGRLLIDLNTDRAGVAP